MSIRRMYLFGLALMIAVAPLLWLNLDPKAGEKLVRLTSKQQAHSTPSR